MSSVTFELEATGSSRGECGWADVGAEIEGPSASSPDRDVRDIDFRDMVPRCELRQSVVVSDGECIASTSAWVCFDRGMLAG